MSDQVPSTSGGASLSHTLAALIVTGISSLLGVLTRASTGAAPTIGNAVLVAGTKVIATTAATAASFVLLTRKAAGGAIGDLTYTVQAGVSITITSASGTDTSTVTWQLFEGV